MIIFTLSWILQFSPPGPIVTRKSEYFLCYIHNFSDHERARREYNWSGFCRIGKIPHMKYWLYTISAEVYKFIFLEFFTLSWNLFFLRNKFEESMHWGSRSVAPGRGPGVLVTAASERHCSWAGFKFEGAFGTLDE